MKEIKFRIWDKTLKQFVGNAELWTVKDMQDDNYHPMQYIGLKDKNNKEIYEGDILDMDGLCFVVWKEGAYWIESPGSNAQDLPSSQDFEKSIVMGNIYENSINDYWR